MRDGEAQFRARGRDDGLRTSGDLGVIEVQNKKESGDSPPGRWYGEEMVAVISTATTDGRKRRGELVSQTWGCDLNVFPG